MFDDFHIEEKNIHIKSHTNIIRVCILFVKEPEPIGESFSILRCIPSIEKDEGALHYTNLHRKVAKGVYITNKKDLYVEYEISKEELTRHFEAEIIWEGRFSGEGCFAIPFDRIGISLKED